MNFKKVLNKSDELYTIKNNKRKIFQINREGFKYIGRKTNPISVKIYTKKIWIE